MTTEPPTLYTIKQTAALLGYSRQRVNQLVHMHNIGTLYGKQYLLTEDEITYLLTRPDHRAPGLSHRWPATQENER